MRYAFERPPGFRIHAFAQCRSKPMLIAARLIRKQHDAAQAPDSR